MSWPARCSTAECGMQQRLWRLRQRSAVHRPTPAVAPRGLGALTGACVAPLLPSDCASCWRARGLQTRLVKGKKGNMPAPASAWPACSSCPLCKALGGGGGEPCSRRPPKATHRGEGHQATPNRQTVTSHTPDAPTPCRKSKRQSMAEDGRRTLAVFRASLLARGGVPCMGYP